MTLHFSIKSQVTEPFFSLSSALSLPPMQYLFTVIFCYYLLTSVASHLALRIFLPPRLFTNAFSQVKAPINE